VAEIDRCIARLKAEGHIDDSRMAENYAAHRTALKAMGKARLGRELSGKLVPKEVIDSALTRVFETVSEDELIDRAIQKRIRSIGVPVSRGDRKKMFDHLARLGFEYELILKKIRSLVRASELEIPDD
jgi:SOS response regulatory protein OraA/RecX